MNPPVDPRPGPLGDTAAPASSSTAKRKRLPRADRRHQLIESARPVFASRGFDGASLEEIAENAGVSRPILYSHFGDKQGLFQAVLEVEVVRIQTSVREAIIAPGEPRDRLERGLRAFFDFVQEHPDGHAVLTQHVTESGLDAMLTDLTDDIRKVIAHVMKSLGHDETAAPLFSAALIGIGSHVGRWWLRNPEMSVEDVTRYATMLVWNGLGELARTGTD